MVGVTVLALRRNLSEAPTLIRADLDKQSDPVSWRDSIGRTLVLLAHWVQQIRVRSQLGDRLAWALGQQ